MEEIGKIGLSPNVREIDLARFQGASWASPLMICVSIFSGLGIGTGELFFFFFFFGSRSNSGEGGWQTILEQPCDLCIAIVIVVITTVSL